MLGKLRLKAPCPPAEEHEFFNLFRPLRPARLVVHMGKRVFKSLVTIILAEQQP